ncbi:MAG: SDR family NAD(P)-dependent oxidoreductase [Bacteroidetes bacterium]|nr:SDR family NAD(P)-dependent oxidoreductase [Bacteroidota bacterium]
MDDKGLVVITGSTGRLGSVLAAGFLNAGYQVVGLDLPSNQVKAWPLIEVDVLSAASIEGAFSEIAKRFGVPTSVIHTVGMWGMSPFKETTLQAWNLMLDLNLTSSFLVFKQAILSMGEKGSLIGIVSRQGAVRGASQQAGYSASKGGLVRLVEAIGAEYEGSDLHVHAIAPSTILFESGQKGGIQASQLLSYCLMLASDEGKQTNGKILEAFGDG